MVTPNLATADPVRSLEVKHKHIELPLDALGVLHFQVIFIPLIAACDSFTDV